MVKIDNIKPYLDWKNDNCDNGNRLILAEMWRDGMIKTIIVDDEKLSLQHLQRKLNDFDNVEVVKAFTNATDVLKEMRRIDFNTAFLDIEMPGLNGLELAEIIYDWNSDIQIVFCTAFRDYAVQAFELHSIDYLLKPLLTDRLQKTITRLERQLTASSNTEAKNKHIDSLLRVKCFGEFVVYEDDSPVKWRTAKARELFAFFIANHQTYIHRDSIIYAIWPDIEYGKAKVQLHTSISYLRKTLKSIGYPDALTFLNECYAMELDKFQCDAIELEQAFHDHTTVNEDNIAFLEYVVDRYKGDYMEQNGYEWALPKVEYYRTLYMQLLQKIIAYYDMKIGTEQKKITYLHRLLQYSPYSEHIIQQLMNCYMDMGNRGKAITIYHTFANNLLEDLGITPDQTTQKLYETAIGLEE